MINLSIDQGLFTRFPAIQVGGFLAAGLDRVVDRLPPDILASMWMDVGAEIARQNVTPQNALDVPALRDWRTVFAACGVKPSTFKSSPEALVRRVLKDGVIRTPLPLVDMYCAASAATLAPLGGYDIDTLPSAFVRLRSARPASDQFEPLGGKREDMPLGERIVVYASEDTVCCYLFNHRDSRSTCLRAATQRALFLSEAATAAQSEPMARALDRLSADLEKFGATVGPPRFVSKDESETTLTFDSGGSC